MGLGIDPTNGATHYYAPKLIEAPAWVTAPGTVKTAEIGDHIFFKAN
jgi:spore germination cell wall hydrolase CwlJ-like protein